jgi:hypothetical protein
LSSGRITRKNVDSASFVSSTHPQYDARLIQSRTLSASVHKYKHVTTIT